MLHCLCLRLWQTIGNVINIRLVRFWVLLNLRQENAARIRYFAEQRDPILVRICLMGVVGRRVDCSGTGAFTITASGVELAES